MSELQVAEEKLHCKNCGYELHPDFEFCPNCGQKVNEELTLRILFYNTISNYFSFDARFIKSFVPLMFKPGYLARKYLDGKRLMFLHPAQMYLFISVVFFFIFSFSVRKQSEIINEELKKSFDSPSIVSEIDSISKINNDSIAKTEIKKVLDENKFITGLNDKQIDSILSSAETSENNNINFEGFSPKELDSLIAINASDETIYNSLGLDADAGWFKRKLYAQFLKFYKARDGGNILKTFYDTIPIALFVLLPLFALILKLLYYKRGRYSHHLVFSFYYFSFLFALFSLIFGINLIWDIPDWIDWLIVLSTFFYLFIALKRFYLKSWIGAFFKAGVATFTFMAVVLPTAAVIIAFYAFLFY
ncbi:MAG: DUF3667 domain-containing protein [Bacteroidota bacterium]